MLVPLPAVRLFLKRPILTHVVLHMTRPITRMYVGHTHYMAYAMKIFVKTVDQQTIPVDVSPQDTVRILKRKLYNEMHIPADQQKLVFSGIIEYKCIISHGIDLIYYLTPMRDICIGYNIPMRDISHL